MEANAFNMTVLMLIGAGIISITEVLGGLIFEPRWGPVSLFAGMAFSGFVGWALNTPNEG